MTKYSMRSIPAAAAIAAALLFSAQAQAQTGMTTPPGSTKPKDQAVPAPGNTATPARAGADGNNSSGSPVGNSATMTGGTTNKKDNVSPAPVAGNGSTGTTAAAGMNSAGAATTVPGTTKSKDNVSPAPVAGSGSTGTTAAAGMNSAGAATTVPGTTKSKDAVMPAPTAGTKDMTAEQRAMAKSEKAKARDAKRAARKNAQKNAAGPTTPAEKANAN